MIRKIISMMVKIRQEKVDKIADYIPEQKLDNGPEKGKVLVLGWGSTYGAIKSAVTELLAEGHQLRMHISGIYALSQKILVIY